MIRMLKTFNKKEVLFILLAIIFIVVQVWLDLKIPDYMAKITQIVQTQNDNVGLVVKNGAFMLLCSLASLVCTFFVAFFAAYTGTSFEKNLRKKVYDKVQSFSMTEINKFSTSSLITRATNDITQVKMFIILGIQMLAKAPITALMAIIKIIGKDWTFSFITIIGVFIVILLNAVIILVAIPKFKKIQKLTDNLNETTQENLKGIRVVRAYNAEDYQLNKFEKANNELTNTIMFTQKLMAFMMPTMTSIMNGLSLAIYWTGAYMINAAIGLDKLTIFSNMVVFSSYSVQILISFMMLVVLFIIYPRAAVSTKRIREVIDIDSCINYKDYNVTLKQRGTLELRNVSFKYPDGEDYAIKNISFSVKTGETLAIIGATGSGKTTIVNLIPRFYDPSEGEVLIDGVNLKDIKEKQLNSKVGFVSQKPVLFKGTIKDNVKLGKKKAADEDIVKALKIAQAMDFIKKMPKGINSPISQSGTNISGGQKQRISIARAIFKNPEIYVFDDSFSALDYKTDYSLRKALNEKISGATKIIVAQRIGTIKDADQIIVLNDGIVVGKGTHKELLNNCQIYKEIAESQLSKEEIENAWS